MFIYVDHGTTGYMRTLRFTALSKTRAQPRGKVACIKCANRHRRYKHKKPACIPPEARGILERLLEMPKQSTKWQRFP
jgi:hypothetical protein